MPCLGTHVKHFGNARLRSFSASSLRNKERLVILGSGWGGYEVLRGIDKKRWDVTIVSANSYFNFTPLLASCAVGTLEFRCAVEPVRRYAPQANIYQAWCDKIDFDQKTLTCVPATPLPSRLERTQVITSDAVEDATKSTSDNDKKDRQFRLHYDKLVIAVGCYAQSIFQNFWLITETGHITSQPLEYQVSKNMLIS